MEWYVRVGFGFGGLIYTNPDRYKLPQGVLAEGGLEFRFANVVLAVGGIKRPDGYTALKLEFGLTQTRASR